VAPDNNGVPVAIEINYDVAAAPGAPTAASGWRDISLAAPGPYVASATTRITLAGQTVVGTPITC
jgi:hypothetical protein